MSKFNLLFVLSIIFLAGCTASKNLRYDAIYSGTPWLDNNGDAVSARGACIVKEGNKYYLFGERKSDTANTFVGFNCYSSPDLYNWKFEKTVLPLQKSGKLGPNRVGERPKVLRCPKTGEYIMYMHVDSTTYKDQYVGYAVSDRINGEYIFKGPLLFNGAPIKKWDLGAYQDTDQSGYVLTHSGNIYKLSDDYTSVTQHLLDEPDAMHGEAPAIIKKDGVYFWLTSGLTSWERNDNFYYTATSLAGPWTERGNFAPKGSLTWNSQTTYVLPITGTEGTTYLYMGDRWSYPMQNSAATYVWQPLQVDGQTLSIPEYTEKWNVNLATGKWNATKIMGKTIEATDTKAIKYSAGWQESVVSDTVKVYSANTKGATFNTIFTGAQITLYGLSKSDGGYAKITIKNSKQEIVLNSVIEMYSKAEDLSPKFVSPILEKGSYSLELEVLGTHGNWTNKKKDIFGSTDNYIRLQKIVVRE
jgi:Glycosyl hydrolases family 43